MPRFGLPASLLAILAFGSFPAAAPAGPCDPAWTPGLFAVRGTDAPVHALVVHDDGSGLSLFAGGEFAVAGRETVSRIARWDGTAWSAVGGGLDGIVSALAVFDEGSGPRLFAGGEFVTAGGVPASRVARWDGSSWSALGSGTDAPVRALAVFDDGSGAKLYAAGEFATAGGGAANRIARWDGASWSAAAGGLDGTVFALATFDDGGGTDLYAGGSFANAGGSPASRVARFDGAAWSALGSGMNTTSSVRALAVFDDGGGSDLYAGGDFTTAGGGAASRIARWDGAAWSALSSGLNSTVFALATFTEGATTSLFAGGAFSTAGGSPANRVARFDGAAWSALGSGIAGTVQALASFDDGSGPGLFAGGSVTTAGGVAASRIARWSGAGWTSLGRGIDNTVLTLAVFDDGAGAALHAGGLFTTAGEAAADRVARFDGADWAPLGLGIGGQVGALATFDEGSGERLFATGNFTTAGGAGANRVARWNGAAWSALGTGLSGPGLALVVFDDGGGPDLYVGGNFSTAGGVAVNSVARWNGASWSGLGSGMNGQVRALAVFDDGSGPALYAGGDFTTAGGAAANRVARWNGSSWSALGSGVNASVHALAGFDDGSGPALYAGGSFTTAGGAAASRLARWNGAAWSSVGGGMSDIVRTLAVFDDGSGAALHAGGDFATAGGVSASRVARWDGAAWSALGGGLGGGNVRALVPVEQGEGGRLAAGGDFTTAGGGASGFVGLFTAGDLPRIVAQPSSLTVCTGGAATFSVTATGTPPLSYQWRKNGVPITGATGSSIAIDPVSPVDSGTFDVVLTNGAGCTRTTLAATLEVHEPPAITTQPASLSGCEGGAVEFTVAAAGGGPFSYRWRKDGVDVPGATLATLAIDPIAIADAGLYDVVVMNDCGSATSDSALLTIDSAPSISRDPSGASVCEGGSVTFSVLAAGTPPFSYRWRKNGADLPGANGDFLAISPVAPADAGSYDVVVENHCGQATSVAAVLEVVFPPAITMHPSDQTACEGDAVTLSVAATGTAPFTYQWRKGGADVPGAVAASLVFPAIMPADAGSYDVVVANMCGAATSDPAAVSVVEAEADGLEFAPSILVGGGASTGRVSLVCPAPAGGAVVALESADPALAAVPPGVMVPEGESEALFLAQTAAVGARTVVLVSATYGGATAMASLTLLDPSRRCLDGAGASAAYFVDTGTGDGTLALGDGRTWTVDLTDVEGSALDGDRTFSLLVQNHAAGTSGETLAMTATIDALGPGGHFLESDDLGSVPRSGHAFDPGEVPGTFDLRIELTRLSDGRFEVVPSFRLPGGGFTLLDGGAWDTALAFDFPAARVAVAISDTGAGTLCFSPPAIASRSCRAGNVNARVGPVANVLFANGTAGDDPDRVVVVDAFEPFELRMERPTSRTTGQVGFALYAWVGVPSYRTQRRLPFALGRSCMPTPLTSDGPPNARQIWNNIGLRSALGEPTLPSSRAPSVVFSKPNGVRKRGSFFFQGFIADAASPNGQAAVTNGILLVSQ